MYIVYEHRSSDLFLCMLSRPALHMFYKIFIEVSSEGRGEGT